MNTSTSNKTYVQAINEALAVCLAKDKNVFLIGEGVPDPKGIFGTTLGLQKKYGRKRVMDMPLSENAVTGACVGAAINGLRPMLNHQRIDFSFLALDQVINSAAKWSYMFNGQQRVPLVIKMTIGMGWGQGPQHSQCLQTLYAHIPGLKVVLPATPAEAKGLMIAAIEDNNPVIFIEHRWLHNIFGPVPGGYYRLPLEKARVVEEGGGLTIVSYSYYLIETLKAVQLLKKIGLNPEVIDLRTIKPLDRETIFNSLKKTGRLLVVDPSYRSFGVAGEILASVAENPRLKLLAKPKRIIFEDCYTPTSPALSKYYYPRYDLIARTAVKLMAGDGKKLNKLIKAAGKKEKVPLDVPDEHFRGPF